MLSHMHCASSCLYAYNPQPHLQLSSWSPIASFWPRSHHPLWRSTTTATRTCTWCEGQHRAVCLYVCCCREGSLPEGHAVVDYISVLVSPPHNLLHACSSTSSRDTRPVSLGAPSATIFSTCSRTSATMVGGLDRHG